MSAAEQTRIHSLETQLEVAQRKLVAKEREYEGRRAVWVDKAEHQKMVFERRIEALEQELDWVKRRKSRLILEMCDMEERLIGQSKEIKTLRSHLQWAKEPSSVT